MITRGKIERSAECCFSILLKPFQRVKHLNSSISLLYTFGEFLAKSLKITHLNLLLITEKVFRWTWLVEPRLWSSFTFHWIILCKSVHILVYLSLQGKRSWTCFDACTFYPHIQRWRRCVDILSRTGNCEKKSTDKKKN